ncbi:hypothetical protein ACIF8W_37245 [Streptomyces sp. NPDC085639]|uniref:hypothetical protein n=1 Tax=Streptomyces sp. NPDC085639 TaxID=3365734 RepID=UPI0037D214BC
MLATTGFTEPDGDTSGLVLRAQADGVLIGWQPAEVVRAVTYVHGHEDALGGFISLPGLHQAVASALTAILGEAGFDVRSGPDGSLRVNRPARPLPGGGSAWR